MPYAFFYEYFPEIAKSETRSIVIPKRLSSVLPAGEYGFLEMYCDERGCDCRRVFFYVISPPNKEPLAVIAYGWENPEFYAHWMGDDSPVVIKELRGPMLNIGSPQSSLAPAILELVKDVLLQDKSYVERIKTHYRMFRDKIDRKLGLGDDNNPVPLVKFTNYSDKEPAMEKRLRGDIRKLSRKCKHRRH